jgi:hypothetical protein
MIQFLNWVIFLLLKRKDNLIGVDFGPRRLDNTVMQRNSNSQSALDGKAVLEISRANTAGCLPKYDLIRNVMKLLTVTQVARES